MILRSSAALRKHEVEFHADGSYLLHMGPVHLSHTRGRSVCSILPHPQRYNVIARCRGGYTESSIYYRLGNSGQRGTTMSTSHTLAIPLPTPTECRAIVLDIDEAAPERIQTVIARAAESIRSALNAWPEPTRTTALDMATRILNQYSGSLARELSAVVWIVDWTETTSGQPRPLAELYALAFVELQKLILNPLSSPDVSRRLHSQLSTERHNVSTTWRYPSEDYEGEDRWFASIPFGTDVMAGAWQFDDGPPPHGFTDFQLGHFPQRPGRWRVGGEEELLLCTFGAWRIDHHHLRQGDLSGKWQPPPAPDFPRRGTFDRECPFPATAGRPHCQRCFQSGWEHGRSKALDEVTDRVLAVLNSTWFDASDRTFLEIIDAIRPPSK